MEKEFKELIKIVKSYSGTDEQISKLKSVWNFAKLAHTGQKRLSGEAYVLHGLATAKILASWKLDATTISAGLLHDAVEDGAANILDLQEKFGNDIAFLVDGVTKISNIRLRGSKEAQFVENLRKMFLAMAKDLRVVLVKLADRLQNKQTLQALPKVKQIRIACETLEIYAPLAERLGIGEAKSQLDDLAFYYVYPEEYKKVKRESLIHFKKAEEHLRIVKTTILRSLAKEKISAKIHGRKKHLFSLWRKLERPEIGWDFTKVHDIVALRVLVETTPQCYTCLGIVHKHYKPVPHLGISDFIAQPKPHGYRSIHTKEFGPGGRIIEVQIRTHKMHGQAEHGIAAHWAYSEAKAKGNNKAVRDDASVFAPSEKLSWVRQLADWQREIKDSKEFLETVKFDALSERIFVFSPKGDVFDLPVDATPVDFAYAVHTELGKYIKGAKVDGKIVPLNYKLGSGQVVEIIKSKNPKSPNTNWLDFVVTNLARRKITQYLRHEKFDTK